MKFLKVHKARKELKEVVHYARHVRHMHEDIAAPEKIDELKKIEKAARKARREGDLSGMEGAETALLQASEKIVPPTRKHAKLRENVEVLFVAIAAAMAIRAYFFQPFKIPTGSMQPTLYGITVEESQTRDVPMLPARLGQLLLKGEVYLRADSLLERIAKPLFIGPEYKVRATSSGYIRTRHTASGNVIPDYRDNFDGGKTVTLFVGDTPHTVPMSVVRYCRYDELIKAGEPLLRGIAKAGDYILVNRIKYNFVRPKRGDIVVFDAQDVTRSAYYIKRLVGLPNETVSIDPKYVLINGEKPTDSRFNKIFTHDNYNGYQFGPQSRISGPGDSITLADDEYLFFGDNTLNSLDGRYFGGVKRQRVLGPAFFVGLPLDRAGFAEIDH